MRRRVVCRIECLRESANDPSDDVRQGPFFIFDPVPTLDRPDQGGSVFTAKNQPIKSIPPTHQIDYRCVNQRTKGFHQIISQAEWVASMVVLNTDPRVQTRSAD